MKKFGIVITLVLVVQLAYSQQAIIVEKSGAGTVLLFLPGFTTPGTVWNETIENLDGDYESHIVSYAGFNGLSPIEFPWYEAIKKELIAYIKKEKLSDVTLIGHSMGGNLAVDVAVALPGQIKGLILLESIPCMLEVMMPGVPASALQYDTPYNNQMLEMSEEDFIKMAQASAQNMTNDPSKAALIAEWTVHSDRKSYVYGYTDLLKLDLREKLIDIEIPTLIIACSLPDREVVSANLEKQFRNLKQKEILLVDDSKHFVMFDQPEWLYTQINKYLRSNVR